MKTFNKKDVFSVANAEDAKQYIDHECYFEDSYRGLQYCIDNNIKGVLTCVRDDDDDNYNTVDFIFVADGDIEVMDGRYITSFGLCLPCDLVKKQEYRPFLNAAEFEAVVGEIGSVITFREKTYNLTRRVLITGVTSHGDSLVFGLGASTYIPRELFEEYVLIKDGKEVPFGIKVNHEES